MMWNMHCLSSKHDAFLCKHFDELNFLRVFFFVKAECLNEDLDCELGSADESVDRHVNETSSASSISNGEVCVVIEVLLSYMEVLFYLF